MKIADIGEVVKVDTLMKEVARDVLSTSAYDNQLKQFTRDVTAGILASAKLFPRMEEDIPCPHCSEGVMKTFGRVAMCDNPECGHYVFRQFYGVTLTHDDSPRSSTPARHRSSEVSVPVAARPSKPK